MTLPKGYISSDRCEIINNTKLTKLKVAEVKNNLMSTQCDELVGTNVNILVKSSLQHRINHCMHGLDTWTEEYGSLNVEKKQTVHDIPDRIVDLEKH